MLVSQMISVFLGCPYFLAISPRLLYYDLLDPLFTAVYIFQVGDFLFQRVYFAYSVQDVFAVPGSEALFPL